MYNVPVEGCNLEIMGYPFFAESVSPTEAFRRRDYNFNGLVGGTQKVTKGAYVGLEFSITTHVYIDPERPDVYNTIFQQMMSEPVEVMSPEIGGSFKAIVVIVPEHEKLDYLKLTINIKEVPEKDSKLVGEEFTVPAPRDVETKGEATKTNGTTGLSTSILERLNIGITGIKTITSSNNSIASKLNSIQKKNKGV